MCEPATLTLIAAGVAAAGTAVTGYMGYQQKRYEAKVDRVNATMKSEEAARAIERQQEDQRNLARKYAALRGGQRVAMAANGIDVDFGSASSVLGDTDMLYREDAATTNANYADEIRGIDISAANYRASAAANKRAATGIAISTGFDVGSSILGAVGKARGMSAARSGGAAGVSRSIGSGAGGYGSRFSRFGG